MWISETHSCSKCDVDFSLIDPYWCEEVHRRNTIIMVAVIIDFGTPWLSVNENVCDRCYMPQCLAHKLVLKQPKCFLAPTPLLHV